MQEQSGISDCGLFAIATATAICNGQDLCILEFDQFLMRKHLLQCFQNGAVLPFPSQSIAARKLKVLKEEVVEYTVIVGSRIQEDSAMRWMSEVVPLRLLACISQEITNWYCSPVCSKTV